MLLHKVSFFVAFDLDDLYSLFAVQEIELKKKIADSYYQSWHTRLMNSLPDILHRFEVIFFQEPRDQQKLDVLESMWINKLLAQININKTVLPKYH